jgi:hypothetical protein
VSTLDEPLEILALHSVHIGPEVAGTGRAVRKLGGERI